MFTGQTMEMKESLDQRTAILLFANSPEEEMKQKPLLKAEKLFSELTQHTLQIIRETGLPFFHYSEKEQNGRNFGERFYNAIQDIFNLGFDYIITLGNDTPQLNSVQILRAVQHLHEGNLVLGPSRDGGFYLMGLHKSQFSTLNFEKLSWQTTHLLSSLISQVHNFGWKYKTFETLIDVDDLNDLRLLVSRGAQIPVYLIAYFNMIIGAVFRTTAAKPDFSYTTSIPTFYNKGSPFSKII